MLKSFKMALFDRPGQKINIDKLSQKLVNLSFNASIKISANSNRTLKVLKDDDGYLLTDNLANAYMHNFPLHKLAELIEEIKSTLDHPDTVIVKTKHYKPEKTTARFVMQYDDEHFY